MYDGRPSFNLPPPPPGGGQHQAYNPKLHAAAAAAGQTINIPPPPPQTEQMSATYIPQGDTFGEGVGIPGLGMPAEEREMYVAMARNSRNTADSNMTVTTLDENTGGDRLYVPPTRQRTSSTTSNATISQPARIPPELAAQWSMDKVVQWLQANGFSKLWQETFRILNIHGTHFLELGGRHAGRGNFGLMHQQVYPTFMALCRDTGAVWDQPREREEGKRMRRLIRVIITNRSADSAKITASSHSRQESGNGGNQSGPATDSADSPNVSFFFLFFFFSTLPTTYRLLVCLRSR